MPTPYGGPMPPNPYGQPQMPDWLTQPATLPVPNSPVQTPDMSQVKRRGMFGNADWGSAIAAALNGYLAAGGNPAGQLGLQQLHQKKMLEQEEALRAQEYQQQRQDRRDDFTFEQDYRAQHPGPINNDTVNDYQFISQTLGPEAGRRYLETKTDPVVMTPMGPMRYSQAFGGGTTPAPPGVTFTPLDDGGPTPPASGGFPGPY